jgi:hypothetical protein
MTSRWPGPCSSSQETGRTVSTKALASGADIIVLDLEDAVAPADKDAARIHVHTWLQQGGHAIVRINSAESEHHSTDLAMVAETGAAVMLPKAERRDTIEAIAATRAGMRIVPLIETAEGILHAEDLCSASDVVRPALGHIDLAAELASIPTISEHYSSPDHASPTPQQLRGGRPRLTVSPLHSRTAPGSKAISITPGAWGCGANSASIRAKSTSFTSA